MCSAESGSSRPAKDLLFLAAATALTVVQLRLLPFTSVDDAYISFRYALNAAMGRGLVWNVGERVEGFSNFLWTVLMIPVAGRAEMAALGLSAAAHVATAWIAYRLAARLRAQPWAVGALVAATPPAIVAVRSLLETSLFTLLVTAALCGWIAKRYRVLGASLALAALTRADGPLLAVGFVTAALATAERRRELRAAWWPLWPAATVAALTAFRLAYYHEWLPNTFFAKGGALAYNLALGGPYVARFFAAFAPLAIGLIPTRRNLAPAALALGGTAYVAAVGGDWLNYYRFLLPLVPALLVSAMTLLRPWKGATVLFLAATLAAYAVADRDLARRVNPRAEAEFRAFCENFRALSGARPGESAAGATIGYFGHRNIHLRVIDLLGLVDAHVARSAPHREVGMKGHDKFDLDYALAQRPDYFFTSNVFIRPQGERLEIDQPDAMHVVEQFLMSHPRFQADFEPVSARIAPGRWVWFWRRTGG